MTHAERLPRPSSQTNARVQVDLTRCQGYAQCVFAAPAVFRMTGLESLEFDAAPSGEHYSAVRRAALACPVQAIAIGSPVETGLSKRNGRRIVIVGGSLAGLRAAAAARAEDADAQIVIIDAETQAAYDRPNLSKGVLTASIDQEGTDIATTVVIDAEWRLGTRAERLDRSGRVIVTDRGEPIPYDRLIIATGARARTWPNHHEASWRGVHTIRSQSDALALRADLEAKPGRVVVIGAGFIGGEVASVCRKLGLPVSVIERASTPLAGLGSITGAAVARAYRAHGVDLRTNAAVERLIGCEGRVVSVELQNGKVIDCDIVVAALGAVRNLDWLEDAQLSCDAKGLEVDEHAQARDTTGFAIDDIYAAGDVARWPCDILDGEIVSIEHWSNALHQGAIAGRNAARTDGPLDIYATPPAFWSNQFGMNIRSVGVPSRGEAFALTQGSLESGRFAGVYGRGGRIVAAVTIDHSRFIDFYESLVRDRSPFPPTFTIANGPFNRT